MNVAGIVCEYNPIHMGHVIHIEKTREAIGGDSAIVCVMSGNFVQRGDFAVFGKRVRAEAAVRCGADLVVEMPAPYALSSAEGFASAGVVILDKLGICDYLCFGSESGDIGALEDVRDALASKEAAAVMRECLSKGIPYAAAAQKAADHILGAKADVLRSPNNLLGVEYLKAIAVSGARLKPITIKRSGGEHDGNTGYSASALRRALLRGEKPADLLPPSASSLFMEEITSGRGPISVEMYEQAMLSRLRAIKDFSALPGATEGLDRRFARCAAAAPTVARILESVKTKRYALSRIRRMLICACLGITASDTLAPPPYIKVLAMNRVGVRLLKEARGRAGLPVITKPASAKKMSQRAAGMMDIEAATTDFYVLAYRDEAARYGGQEWRQTPVVVEDGER